MSGLFSHSQGSKLEGLHRDPMLRLASLSGICRLVQYMLNGAVLREAGSETLCIQCTDMFNINGIFILPTRCINALGVTVNKHRLFL